MRAFLYSSILFLLAATSSFSALEISPEDKVKLAEQVHTIFQAKCVDCHGSHLARPKGQLGHILDLNRIAENPDYVVRGNADESEIYQMVLNNEMPGEDSDIPALTPEEVEVVKRWIDSGAAGDLPVTAATGAVVTPVAHTAVITSATTVNAKPPESFWRTAIRWIGKFHPVSTHFPVALMFVAVLAEGIGWWTRRDSWLTTVRFLVVLAAAGGVAAGVLGWINAHFSSYDKAQYALLWWHRWLGTGTVLWAVVCAAAAFMGECQEGSKERIRFRVALLLGAGLVGISGFLGSALIYGLDHYSWK